MGGLLYFKTFVFKTSNQGGIKMELYFRVFKNDLRLIFRDKSLYVMFVIPVAIILICNLGVPPLAAIIPSLPDYYWLIVAAFTSLSASTPAFLIGFILLDERDENVHTILKVLPLPPGFILKCRILFMAFLGFIFSFCILLLNGLSSPDLLHIIPLSLLFALIPPILALTIASFAKNKIEAATFYKGLCMLLFLPVVSFFIKGGWSYFFGVIPFYWTFKAFQLMPTLWSFLLFFVVSVSAHLITILMLYNLYKRRVI